MKFKIKDNVKLQLLEELGFNYDGLDTYSIEYEGTYIMINKDNRILRFSYLGFSTDLIKIDDDIKLDFEMPIILYTLIKLDLIEII